MKVPIKLPQEVELLIQSGQNVDFSTPLLRKKNTNRVKPRNIIKLTLVISQQ